MSDTPLMIVVLELLAILVVLITLVLRFVQFGARLEKIAKKLSNSGGQGHHDNRTPKRGHSRSGVSRMINGSS